MGWCSATDIFDRVIDAIEPYIQNHDLLLEIAEKVAEPLWDGDWDCESDSKYYETLLDPIMRKRHPDWFDDEDE